MIKSILESLSDFSPKLQDNYIEVSFPVVMNVSFSYLRLRIVPREQTYKIYCPDDLFREKNDSQKRYFDIFMKWDKSYHYGMQIDENHLIYKEFKNNYNPLCAIDEFIRFFILLDDFIMDNNVVGREDDFD